MRPRVLQVIVRPQLPVPLFLGLAHRTEDPASVLRSPASSACGFGSDSGSTLAMPGQLMALSSALTVVSRRRSSVEIYRDSTPMTPIHPGSGSSRRSVRGKIAVF
ncbi:hypothetical protein PG984_003000 [Apiospora sp. TS-2023a]